MSLSIFDTLEPQGDYPAAKAKDVAMDVRPGEINLKPGIYYKFGEVAELAVKLEPGFKDSASEYVFDFTPMEGFTTPTISPDVTWLGSPQFPEGKRCIVSVLNGLAVSGCG